MSQMMQVGEAIVCYEPMREHSRVADGVKWCFKCRKRREFWDVMTVPTEQFSYYGPNRSIRCGSCNAVDTDLFPGWSREWGEE